MRGCLLCNILHKLCHAKWHSPCRQANKPFQSNSPNAMALHISLICMPHLLELLINQYYFIPLLSMRRRVYHPHVTYKKIPEGISILPMVYYKKSGNGPYGLLPNSPLCQIFLDHKLCACLCLIGPDPRGRQIPVLTVISHVTSADCGKGKARGVLSTLTLLF